MPLQVVFGIAFHSPAAIEVAPVHTRKVGGVIDERRTLAFEKLINVQVCLDIDVISFNNIIIKGIEKEVLNALYYYVFFSKTVPFGYVLPDS